MPNRVFASSSSSAIILTTFTHINNNTKKKERLNTHKIPGICTQKQKKVREETK
jgi:hypothetical protein